jgi:hypothetical protein
MMKREYMMVRAHIQLTEEQAKILKALAAQQGVSVADLIQRGVDEVLKTIDGVERRQRALAAAGKFRSGRSDLSAEHDHYLAEAYEG